MARSSCRQPLQSFSPSLGPSLGEAILIPSNVPAKELAAWQAPLLSVKMRYYYTLVTRKGVLRNDISGCEAESLDTDEGSR